MIQTETFVENLPSTHRKAWRCIKSLVIGFFGKHRDPNYVTIVADLMEEFRSIGVNMSAKIHFLHAHLDYFPANCSDFSDEQGERFHQDLSFVETCYKGKNLQANMIARYCNTIVRKSTVPTVRTPRKKRIVNKHRQSSA